MSKRPRTRRTRATILRGTGRPSERVLVETFIARLAAEADWQTVFADDERVVWLDAAARYFRLQRKAGFALDEAYALVLAMLQHASALLIERSEATTKPAMILRQ